MHHDGDLNDLRKTIFIQMQDLLYHLEKYYEHDIAYLKCLNMVFKNLYDNLKNS